MTSENEREQYDAEQVRALLADETPDFQVSRSLGDRALAGAARRRTRVRRAFGGAGAVVLVTAGVVAVVPLAGWAGHGSGRADAVTYAGTSGTSTESPSPSGPSPTSATSRPALPTQTRSLTKPSIPDFESTPKQKAVERVMTALGSGHDNSYMGVGYTGLDYANGTFKLASVYDASPIIVYRKPADDPTLQNAAIAAAAPYTVVFQDTVLDASEQWYLGNRIQKDRDYWAGQGVKFGTALQMDGTITITADDPGKVVGLLERHYGYDGRVFVGAPMPVTLHPASAPGSLTPPASGSGSGPGSAGS